MARFPIARRVIVVMRTNLLVRERNSNRRTFLTSEQVNAHLVCGHVVWKGTRNFPRMYDLSLGPILCGQTHFARVQMAMSTNGSRLLQFAADEIESDEFVEDLRRYLALPRMVPEILLPENVVNRQHFLQWHPRVFERGNVWNTGSFLLDGNITANEIYLFVAVLFSVDNKMRDGEPRVWRELIAAWDATFGLAAGELHNTTLLLHNYYHITLSLFQFTTYYYRITTFYFQITAPLLQVTVVLFCRPC